MNNFKRIGIIQVISGLGIVLAVFLPWFTMTTMQFGFQPRQGPTVSYPPISSTYSEINVAGPHVISWVIFVFFGLSLVWYGFRFIIHPTARRNLVAGIVAMITFVCAVYEINIARQSPGFTSNFGGVTASWDSGAFVMCCSALIGMGCWLYSTTKWSKIKG